MNKTTALICTLSGFPPTTFTSPLICTLRAYKYMYLSPHQACYVVRAVEGRRMLTKKPILMFSGGIKRIKLSILFFPVFAV